MSHVPSPPSDDSDTAMSSTPTPASHLHRSVSHNSQRSAIDTPQHHHQGTSYFNAPTSPSTRHSSAPRLVRSTSNHSARRGARSMSLSSTTRNAFGEDDTPSEVEEAGDSDSDSSEVDGAGPDASVRSQAGDEAEEEDPITLKDRQSLINVEHPFGLPIWKPALYKKSRSVTRYADEALHSVPSAQAERHLLPGNIFWVICFGWWLSLVCFSVSGVLYIVPEGGKRYSSLIFGLGWYIAWPFGKYVEGDIDPKELEEDGEEDENEEATGAHDRHDSAGSTSTVRGDEQSTVRGAPTSDRPAVIPSHTQTMSWNTISVPTEHTSLLNHDQEIHFTPAKSYGTTISPSSTQSSIGISKQTTSSDLLGRMAFWLLLASIIAPLMLIVCIICWALVVTIPMAKLTWALLTHMFQRPTTIRFCSAPASVVVSSVDTDVDAIAEGEDEDGEIPATASVIPRFSVKHPRISAGQVAPSGSPTAKVLLCTYRAVGWKFYKYTVAGVNIMFVNLMPVVFFVIFDGLVILKWVEKYEEEGRPVPAFLHVIASPAVVFIMSLLSVIPLSYFIGMAVASISAQSSIGMGAVINATFGSLIEVILYGMALTQHKGHLVEGSIVGSFLAGVLLMPGASMCSMAIRRKEMRFNAKSAGVTSMMLIMAVIGVLVPTLFYQTYGNFQLICNGCPEGTTPKSNLTNMPWVCDHCYYQHPDPVDDPFYQSTVKSLMYFCAIILVVSYLIGLWFSLRTHATQIWQNPRELLKGFDLPIHNRTSLYPKTVPNTATSRGTLQHKPSNINSSHSRPQSPLPREHSQSSTSTNHTSGGPPSPIMPRRVSYANAAPPGSGYTPVMESVDQAVKHSTQGLQNLQLPEVMTRDDFTRAVAVATVSALRHQQAVSPGRTALRASNIEESGGHGGHDAPSWSRTTSASILLGCTALYAVIAEILVDVVDVVLDGSGIDEKFLGVTLFALVPNTTEFMNAMSFALNGNIALSMEIGSAYALQVCLLQIPAMVAFSAWYAPEKMGEVASTFTLIFPRWDVIAIILSMFLMTYTYIEAKSNYHRGSILILSYLVLTAGFYFAPGNQIDVEVYGFSSQVFTNLSVLQYARWYISSWF